MSKIRFQESNGKLQLGLPKEDSKWSSLNEQITKQTGGTWNNSLSCWDIPKSDINTVKNILNKVVDNDAENSDASDDEGYTTDDGEDVPMPPQLKMSTTSVHSKNSKNSKPFKISSRGDNTATNTTADDDSDNDDDYAPAKSPVHSRSRSRDNDDDDFEPTRRISKLSRTSHTSHTSHISKTSHTSNASEDNVFDYITDDARLVKIKKIMKIRGFQYYLKCNLPKNEFRYLLQIGEV